MTALPGRVFVECVGVNGSSEETLVVSWLPRKGAVSYVPEQRALDAERERDAVTDRLKDADSVFGEVTKALGYERWWYVPSDPGKVFLERDSEKPGFITAMPLMPAITTLRAQVEESAKAVAERDALKASGGRVRGTARTLREERDAMIPLARLGLGGLDGGSYYLDALVRLGVSKPTGEETPATIAARAILGRVP